MQVIALASLFADTAPLFLELRGGNGQNEGMNLDWNPGPASLVRRQDHD
jgi:hypothetical protein